MDITSKGSYIFDGYQKIGNTLNIYANCHILIISINENCIENIEINLLKEDIQVTVRIIHFNWLNNKTSAFIDLMHKARRTTADVKGFLLSSDNSEITIHFNNRIINGMKNSSSHQMLRGIVEKNGKIVCLPGLMVDEADVIAASHGNSLGQISQELIYYLGTKGLTIKQAKWLIIEGYITSFFEKEDTDLLGETLAQLQLIWGQNG